MSHSLRAVRPPVSTVPRQATSIMDHNMKMNPDRHRKSMKWAHFWARKKGLSWLAIASSKPFRFVVGSEQREFPVSSALVAHQSPTLRVLIYGDFCEARNGCVTLDWVDEYTFTRFIQYAYTGDYDATGDDAVLLPVDRKPALFGPHELRGDKELLKSAKRIRGLKRRRRVTEGEGPEEAPKRQRHFEPPEVHALKPSATSSPTRIHSTTPWNRFYYVNPMDRKFRLGQSGLMQRFSHAANRFNRIRFEVSLYHGEEDGEMLLRHAKMYVFADYYGISDLMELSQNNLGELLLSSRRRGARLAGVVALIRYCYKEPAPESLKTFVMMYAAWRAELLWKDAGFRDLAEETPELSLDLLTQAMMTCGITDKVPRKKK